jgi:hypothetical protein
MSAGNQPTNQHFILIFSALKEVEQDEFKLIIMKLYEGWRTGQGEGAYITVIQLLACADSEYKRLQKLGQWTTKNKVSETLQDLIPLRTIFQELSQICKIPSSQINTHSTVFKDNKGCVDLIAAPTMRPPPLP